MDINTYTNYKERLEYALNNDLLDEDSFDIRSFDEEIIDMERDIIEAIDINEFSNLKPEVSDKKLRTLSQLVNRVKSEYNVYIPKDEEPFLYPNGRDEED